MKDPYFLIEQPDDTWILNDDYHYTETPPPCHHNWEEVGLFTSVYEKCKWCQECRDVK
jgi:hypothetical protein